MAQLVNLTPYTLHLPGGLTLPARAAPLCHETIAPTGFLNDVIPLIRKAYGPVEGLPPPNGVMYIVEDAVRRAHPERADLFGLGDVVDTRGAHMWLANLVTV